MRHLLSAVVLCSGVLYAAFDPSFWALRRQVNTRHAAFDVLPLDATVYSSSRAELNDLRLLRSGIEVPYVLRTLSGGLEEHKFRPPLMDRMAIPGVGTQAIVDVGARTPHNRLTIETDKSNFRQVVRVEASDDRKHWGLIRRDGTIFDVSTPDQHAASLSVSYPESTRRYLRLTIEGWNNPETLRSVSMSFVRESKAERETVADQQAKAARDERTRSSVLEVDLGYDRPFDRITFDVKPEFFSRAVTVSVSPDRKTWTTAGFGTIERTSRREDSFVSLPEQWARYIRVSVRNEDNPPLTFSRLRVEALRRELLFPAGQAGSYWLYMGNPKAEPVHYDLRTVLPAEVIALPATFGTVETNPKYQAPKPPVTERSPWLLSGLLIVLVPVLGAIAFRMLRQVNTSR